MYFKSRTEAGIALAEKIIPKYVGQKCAVIALSDGAVLVATQIALRLRCVMMLLLTETIDLPREPVVVATVDQEGGFTYNSAYSKADIEEFQGEYRTYIDQERMQKTHDLNQAIGKSSLIRRSLLKKRNIILVSDGLNGAFSIDSATEFLKPIEIKRLIVATPMASLPAVDRMHILADEIYCLSVIEDYLSTEHYYEVNDVPDHKVIIETVKNILDNWPK
jgi:putative phosphoribosyl transferase